MEKTTLLTLFATIISFLFSNDLHGQETLKPRPSPTAVVTMKYENTYVKITYCQPHKRGRVIFGDLVPYGKVWRTGANEASEITLTNDILINTDTLKAGTYSIFTVPRKEKWTVIFNRELGQWGAYNYVEKSDILRVEVPTQKVEDVVWEPFTISFAQVNDKADLQLMWDKTKVSIPLKFID
ncbi:DUF2911 domain-containing protein [Fulvivirga sp. M361]|uniref:DUF2911 domain-containing protein n=1 Tax=Fulvivirga sp. M361 TaxID=2594266 RepID=UPI001179C754|nr:DUF2911 domain-containing protein [Fulvivirga sp. M361]TRX60710.1 DUF2911 domain-containing protein [Fulvivirga sp. M361]